MVGVMEKRVKEEKGSREINTLHGNVVRLLH